MAANLGELQRLLRNLITAPEGVAARLEMERPPGGIEALIRGDDRVGAAGRVEIYAGMYFNRLLEGLREDFPGLLKMLGESDFRDLTREYLRAHPPSRPSIFHLGCFMADFIRDDPAGGGRPQFASDLARLERTLIEVFHAADVSVIDEAAMRRVPVEQWPAMRVRLVPAVAMLDLRWRVGETLSRVEAGGFEESQLAPEEHANTIMVWRKDGRVFYREIDDAERAGIIQARDGGTLAEIFEAIAVQSNAGDPVAELNRIIQRWIASEILTSA